MSIADKLQTILENEQKIYNAGYEKGKSEGGGGGVNKLASVVDGTVTELTAQDLAGATNIRSHAFRNYSNLTNVGIPDSVKKFGEYAFYQCSNLTSIVIPNNVTELGAYSFSSCSKLTSVTIGNKVYYLGMDVFSSCRGLTNVVIPDNVTYLGSSAFSGCTNLTSVVIGVGINNIQSSSFINCSNLKRVDFSRHESVPSLSGTNAFLRTHADLQIKVPASLIDSWKSATNWSNYASKIVTEFTNTL